MAVIQPRPTHILYQCAKFGCFEWLQNSINNTCKICYLTFICYNILELHKHIKFYIFYNILNYITICIIMLFNIPFLKMSEYYPKFSLLRNKNKKLQHL